MPKLPIECKYDIGKMAAVVTTIITTYLTQEVKFLDVRFLTLEQFLDHLPSSRLFLYQFSNDFDLRSEPSSIRY
jgi:hypothetical protein